MKKHISIALASVGVNVIISFSPLRVKTTENKKRNTLRSTRSFVRLFVRVL